MPKGINKKGINKSILKECKFCGIFYIVNKAREKSSKYCSKQCQCKGIRPLEMKKETKIKIGLANKGNKRPDALIYMKNRNHLGENNPNWKGGKSENQALRRIIKRQKWHLSVFKRDNYTCQMCYKRGGDLEAHHIKRLIDRPDLMTDLNNGITLCKNCHNKTKGNELKYEKQLRQAVEKYQRHYQVAPNWELNWVRGRIVGPKTLAQLNDN